MPTQPPPYILVVTGNYDQFRRYMELHHWVSVPALSTSVLVGTTTYVSILRLDDALGYSRQTPLVFTGTYWVHGWIFEVQGRFNMVHYVPD